MTLESCVFYIRAHGGDGAIYIYLCNWEGKHFKPKVGNEILFIWNPQFSYAVFMNIEVLSWKGP